jgi:type VI secretion system protein
MRNLAQSGVCRSIVVAGVLAALVAGCNAIGDGWQWAFGDPKISSVTIDAQTDANDSTPVAVDLVAIKDSAAFSVLSNLKASDWFSGRDDWIRQYQQQLKVDSWEVVPGSHLNVVISRPGGKVVGYLIFANYLGSKIYRARVSGVKHITIMLGSRDVDVQLD